jgi:hypothetical protein
MEQIDHRSLARVIAIRLRNSISYEVDECRRKIRDIETKIVSAPRWLGRLLAVYYSQEILLLKWRWAALTESVRAVTRCEVGLNNRSSRFTAMDWLKGADRTEQTLFGAKHWLTSEQRAMIDEINVELNKASF